MVALTDPQERSHFKRSLLRIRRSGFSNPKEGSDPYIDFYSIIDRVCVCLCLCVFIRHEILSLGQRAFVEPAGPAVLQYYSEGWPTC